MTGFPTSIFALWENGAVVVEKAMPLMKAYKRKDANTFDGTSFDYERPWFVRLWSVVEPGSGNDPIEMNATMMDEAFVELLAFVGAEMKAYPMLMLKKDFDLYYKPD